MAQADLIPINPVILEAAGGGHCCQGFQLQLSPPEGHSGTKACKFADGVALSLWRYQGIYQTLAGSFVGDNANLQTKKKIPQITKKEKTNHAK